MWGLLVTCLVSQPCTDEVIDTYPTRSACEIVAPAYADRKPECLKVAGIIHKDGSSEFTD